MRVTRRTFVKSVAGAVAALPKNRGEHIPEPSANPTPSAPGTAASPLPLPSTPGSLSLLDSMTLAGKHLLTVLNPRENYLPYFNMTIGKDYRAAFVFTWPGHNIGRWLDALLRLENAMGFVIPPPLEKAMRENL